MKIYNDLYENIISLKNLLLAYKKAKKGKAKKDYVNKFEENLAYNIKILHEDLKNESYRPKPLVTFILRDPKTRRISKSIFRDRIVHHAIVGIVEPFFDKTFIYDSCANRIGKGTLFALKRLEVFQRKVTSNLSRESFCLKADIKHYFQELDRNILLRIIRKKIGCEKTLRLIELIIYNFEGKKGMPLGNLTSQFFANVYLNELDYFVKHELKAKYYIRYVDDFVILHSSKKQLKRWKQEIDLFLKENLKLELHPDKSRIISLSKGIGFLGFRNFYHFRLLRNRNIIKIESKIKEFNKKLIDLDKFLEIWKGWNAYSKWSNNYNLINKLKSKINLNSFP